MAIILNYDKYDKYVLGHFEQRIGFYHFIYDSN